MSRPVLFPLETVLGKLLNLVEPLGSEEVAAEAAVGRYLAAEVIARRTQPAADLSAMDGYAVRADDLAGPWQVVGESAAGHPFDRALLTGEAVRISTGALMPAGEGAVMLQEEAVRDGAGLRLTENGEATPRHIRRAGFDFREGDPLLRTGTRIGAPQLALAIASGHAVLPVGRRPHVAILDSGDELASDPTRCGVHQIPASNGPMLAAMAAPLASRVDRIGPVADRLDAMVAAFDRAADADVLVTSGGASVGDHDLLRPALEQWGATVEFWRVAMKPGKPVLAARRGKQVILGLPGNPASSYVTAFVFLLPLLRALAGAETVMAVPVVAPLIGPMPPTGDRLEFVRACYTGGSVAPWPQQDSSALTTLAASNALIRRYKNSPGAQRGDAVHVYLLENGGIA
jgi:molybdopterin molybdotransferase